MNYIIAGVHETEKVIEIVVVLMNVEWHNAVTDLGCVSSRTLCVNVKFSKVKGCGVEVYSPTDEEVEEREKFWWMDLVFWEKMIMEGG